MSQWTEQTRAIVVAFFSTGRWFWRCLTLRRCAARSARSRCCGARTVWRGRSTRTLRRSILCRTRCVAALKVKVISSLGRESRVDWPYDAKLLLLLLPLSDSSSSSFWLCSHEPFVVCRRPYFVVGTVVCMYCIVVVVSGFACKFHFSFGDNIV